MVASNGREYSPLSERTIKEPVTLSPGSIPVESNSYCISGSAPSNASPESFILEEVEYTKPFMGTS